MCSALAGQVNHLIGHHMPQWQACVARLRQQRQAAHQQRRLMPGSLVIGKAQK
jgi:hypothetical protein